MMTVELLLERGADVLLDSERKPLSSVTTVWGHYELAEWLEDLEIEECLKRHIPIPSQPQESKIFKREIDETTEEFIIPAIVDNKPPTQRTIIENSVLAAGIAWAISWRIYLQLGNVLRLLLAVLQPIIGLF
ncbi:Protein of unknown function [Pyronema omphalodes CBS 100304]|uniref:Uncharacterized protein n=1 Tax=Pyronema omphalodes (strain CBS 100304) TaxID=1076935 RepID=U4KVI8_PYROM|nr:Protein of unknown function [Pyronema omphalodes CBS 100304]